MAHMVHWRSSPGSRRGSPGTEIPHHMNRLGHQAAAQATWLGYCTFDRFYDNGETLMMSWQHVLAGAIVASSMCADDWSPDATRAG